MEGSSGGGGQLMVHHSIHVRRTLGMVQSDCGRWTRDAVTVAVMVSMLNKQVGRFHGSIAPNTKQKV